MQAGIILAVKAMGSIYHQTSNIRRTKSQHFNTPRLAL